MGERRVARRQVLRVGAGGARRAFDAVAGEEPMEVRVDGTPVSVTMRTPGNDFELALGFCLTEGILEDPAEVAAIRYCGDDGRPAGTYNVVDVRRRVPAPLDGRLRRNVYTTSSCGVCGTTSIDAVGKRARGDVGEDHVRVEASVLASLPDRLRDQQRLFDRTGGLHAAALVTAGGEMRCVREDVGRHNAVDKVLGWAASRGELPLRGHLLVLSGRVAFEIVQKAAVAGVPVVAAVSAPTSLAVDLAASVGATLVGFIRGGTMNVYTRSDRVIVPESGAEPLAPPAARPDPCR
ncbi:MAG: formate dehydrogenase accessory sulfurtransferase FdhD [Actinomycetota bacterium]|nr:formate dehydrogenase accessory sulfurtransferase FdhD [Actinomycetota bacterium]